MNRKKLIAWSADADKMVECETSRTTGLTSKTNLLEEREPKNVRKFFTGTLHEYGSPPDSLRGGKRKANTKSPDVRDEKSPVFPLLW